MPMDEKIADCVATSPSADDLIWAIWGAIDERLRSMLSGQRHQELQAYRAKDGTDVKFHFTTHRAFREVQQSIGKMLGKIDS